ncbi:MAG: hypothetical protein A2Y38_04130 [Spirochaetes bacterium GWB1_59_5]|nr:MAG: hypothetical protein A2Y38_04130 [Spirochaetes bacterium GWB1_59_5]
MSKWYVVGAVVLIAIGSFLYGITQLNYSHEREKTALIQEQYQLQVAENKTLRTQFDQQKAQTDVMRTQVDDLKEIVRSREVNRSGTTITMKYDPVTGKLVERLESRLDEMERERNESRSESHSDTAATSSAVVLTSSLSVATASSTTSFVASSTTAISEKDKVEVKPADGGKNREMRVTIGAALRKGKVHAVAGYQVSTLGVGNIIQVGPQILAGDDIVGAGVSADILGMPRVGVGYGCDFKMRGCSEVYNVGLRLDF